MTQGFDFSSHYIMKFTATKADDIVICVCFRWMLFNDVSRGCVCFIMESITNDRVILILWPHQSHEFVCNCIWHCGYHILCNLCNIHHPNERRSDHKQHRRCADTIFVKPVLIPAQSLTIWGWFNIWHLYIESGSRGPSPFKHVVLPVYIPILKIRRSRDRAIFSMEIPCMGKTVFKLRLGPDR